MYSLYSGWFRVLGIEIGALNELPWWTIQILVLHQRDGLPVIFLGQLTVFSMVTGRSQWSSRRISHADRHRGDGLWKGRWQARWWSSRWRRPGRHNHKGLVLSDRSGFQYNFLVCLMVDCYFGCVGWIELIKVNYYDDEMIVDLIYMIISGELWLCLWVVMLWI